MVKINTSEFLKASDLTGETLIQFVDEGKYVDSRFEDEAGNKKQNFNITVAIGEDEKTWTMNKTSQRAIADAYGSDTEKWVGRHAKLNVVKMLVGKEMKDVVMGEGAVDVAPVEAEPTKWDD